MQEKVNDGIKHNEVNIFLPKGSAKKDSGGQKKAPAKSHRVDNCIMLSTDIYGNITRINDYGKAFWGRALEDDNKRKFSDIVLPENCQFDRRKKRFVDNFLFTPGENGAAEFETRCASGSPKRIAWNRSAVIAPDGRVDEMLYGGIEVQDGASEKGDTTSFCEAGVEPNYFKSRPCHSKSNYSLLEKYIGDSKIWAWEMGADERFCYVSPGVEKLTGFNPDELIGKKMDFFLPSNSKNGFSKVLEETLLVNSRHFQFENQIRRKDGKKVWAAIDGIIFCDEKGAFLGARGVNRDISIEVSGREELALREQGYRYLFDNVQVALIMLNEEGVILNINQSGAKMHERTPGEMIGRNFSKFLHEDNREFALNEFKKNFQRAKSQRTDLIDIENGLARVDSPKGIRCLQILSKAVRVMEGDQMDAILISALDVTESLALQETLERYQLKLHQLVDERTKKIQLLQDEMLRNERLTALGKLTSTVSHEIRNPLGTISSSLYIINECLKGRDYHVGPAIDRGSRAIQRCDGIIEEMLDFARTKGLVKRMVNISSWLEKNLDGMVISKNVHVIKNIAPDLNAPIDIGRFQRCVLNILENSQEALKDRDEGSIQVDANFVENRIEIIITDTGSGIPDAHRGRVFDPLFSTKRNGIGMGLPVCRQVMELHEGSIEIISDTGSGTTVTLRLPTATIKKAR
jgi:PAS domain S-box-containing protein